MSGCECKRDSAQPVINVLSVRFPFLFAPETIRPDPAAENRSRWKFKSSADYSKKSLNI